MYLLTKKLALALRRKSGDGAGLHIHAPVTVKVLQDAHVSPLQNTKDSKQSTLVVTPYADLLALDAAKGLAMAQSAKTFTLRPAIRRNASFNMHLVCTEIFGAFNRFLSLPCRSDAPERENSDIIDRGMIYLVAQ